MNVLYLSFRVFFFEPTIEHRFAGVVMEPLVVPLSLGAKQLSEILSHLLGMPVDFVYAIDGTPLQSDLETHFLLAKGTPPSGLQTIFFGHPPQDQQLDAEEKEDEDNVPLSRKRPSDDPPSAPKRHKASPDLFPAKELASLCFLFIKIENICPSFFNSRNYRRTPLSKKMPRLRRRACALPTTPAS